VNKPLDRAIGLCSGVGKLAEAIGVGQSVISNWKARNTQIDPAYCARIERATSSAVTCEELRPDVKWVRVKDKDWPNKSGRPLVDHTDKRGR
jgi:DNA-binding transcriptional regulator YdaS (Cro superfamily)